MDKFWNFKEKKIKNDKREDATERILVLQGIIAEDSWFGDEATPAAFKEELNSGKGDITVWINSPGGDCFAAAQIYNALREYKGKVTIKIDGIACSAASVIAMSGDEVLMSPVSMMMIHNPSTTAYGDHFQMEKVIEMLDGVKNSIINAYHIRTNISRNKLAKMMDDETWMDATKAKEMKFADGIIGVDTKTKDSGELENEEKEEGIWSDTSKPCIFSQKKQDLVVVNKITASIKMQAKPKEERSVKDYMERLINIKNFI